eukprot:TRINITY_DN7064_c0_g1_i1.p1 TRINITY_DN7064_c0_g1~~TRINITY_DN7064_c0_g1_i1.p1  ORF type:complete len:308 (+),score=57.66 TRINITY_DN7064_c0_g1_i1:111-1034(+)
MIRRPPRSTQGVSSAASDVYKRQVSTQSTWDNLQYLHVFDIEKEEYRKYSFKKLVDEESSYVQFSNCILIAGGKKEGVASSDCLILTLMDNLLESQIASMNIAKFQTSLVFAQGKFIYSLGGFSDDGTSLNICEEYSIQNNTWTNTKSLQEAKGNFAACCLNNFIYVFGGKIDEIPNYSIKIEQYDLVKQSGWIFIQFSSLYDPSILINCGVCPYEEKSILIFGSVCKENLIFSTENNDFIALDTESIPDNDGFQGKPMCKYKNKYFAVDINLNLYFYEKDSETIIVLKKEIWASSSVPAIPSISSG